MTEMQGEDQQNQASEQEQIDPEPATPASAGRVSNMKDQLDSATDAVKQVITLSAGILTLTLTFAKTLAAGADSGWQLALRLSWGLLGLAIMAGFLFLLMKTGVIYEGKDTDIYDWRLRGPWLAQVLLFVAAIVIIFLFGFTQFADIPAPSPEGL